MTRPMHYIPAGVQWYSHLSEASIWKKYADLLVTYYDSTLKSCLEQNHKETLSLKVSVDIGVDLEALIQEVEAYGVTVHYDYDENLERQTIRFEGENLCDEQFPMSDTLFTDSYRSCRLLLSCVCTIISIRTRFQ